MNIPATDHGASLRVLDDNELASVAGGGPALNWTVGGAVLGAKAGAPFGPNGALFGAVAGAAYYLYYYETTK